MNILYGVAGVGFGHASRASSIATHLEKQDHKIIILTYDQGYKFLKIKFKTFKANGPSLVFQKGALKKRKTIKFNTKNLPKNILQWKKFQKLMKEFHPDICITDMEPLVPILRNWYNLPLISIDNQHRLTNLEISVPKKHKKDFLIAKKVVKTFVKRADKFIITSFSKEKVTKKNTSIVPPIVRKEIQSLKPQYGKNILVYLSRKDRKILRELKIVNEKFLIYGYNTNRKDGNLEFKTKNTFLNDLENCKAVIGTSGFTLMTEAIYLNKPYFAIPLKGQFEQVLNSLFLKKAKFGDYSENLKGKEIESFLNKLPQFRKKLRSYKPDHNQLFKVLDSSIKSFNKKKN